MSLITSHLGLYENASFLEAIHLKPNDILFLVPILIPTAGENLLLYSEKDYSIVSSAAGATSFFSPPCVCIQWADASFSIENKSQRPDALTSLPGWRVISLLLEMGEE